MVFTCSYCNPNMMFMDILNLLGILFLDAQPNNRSDPPWLREDIIEKCTDQLESTNGPVVYRNGEIVEYEDNMELLISQETPCIIITKFNEGNFSSHGLGCYYGNGNVLTALHVVKEPNLKTSKILIAFPTEDFILVYRADLKFPNTDTKRDLAFVKLLGNTHPPGDGLQNKIAEVNKNDRIYFYTRAPNGNFQKQEGKICRPNSSMRQQMGENEFVTSVAGNEGDSGSPVFNDKHELIGIYVKVFTHHSGLEYGCFSEISNFLQWV
ncbi:hypothetical protein KOW79_000247 [Hemibagrus wyckioides]|uniref:Serine protease n=1 Tax=Hemibagrus wyckioides TaxID=337641 RepID=A0A9D3SXV8_9TELE|nr:hypothetical protein KOW79_000247 [Hemibagrus wyckioides]